MTASSTTSAAQRVLVECRNTSAVPTGPHGPHAWHGHICPGQGELAALTFTQVAAIADALGLDRRVVTQQIISKYTETEAVR